MKNVRPEIATKNNGGLLDLFDNVIKLAFNITDAEYDYIAENATDAELEKFVSAFGTIEETPTFSDRRAALEVRNKYLKQMNDETLL